MSKRSWSESANGIPVLNANKKEKVIKLRDEIYTWVP
jgi:hypothetical protein